MYNSIQYRDGRAKQQLGTLSSSDFSGTFDEVIARLNTLRGYYENVEINVSGIYAGEFKEKTKKLTFDKVVIDFEYDSDTQSYTQPVINGLRDITAEEQSILNSQELKKQERDKAAKRAEFERLKNELGE